MPKGVGLAILSGSGPEDSSKEGSSGKGRSARDKAEQLQKQASEQRERLFKEGRKDAAKQMLKAIKSGNESAFVDALDEYFELRF